MFEDSLTSPVGIAIQVLMLAGLVALVRIDWVGVLARLDARRARRQEQTATGDRERSAVTTEVGSTSTPDDPRQRET